MSGRQSFAVLQALAFLFEVHGLLLGRVDKSAGDGYTCKKHTTKEAEGQRGAVQTRREHSKAKTLNLHVKAKLFKKGTMVT